MRTTRTMRRGGGALGTLLALVLTVPACGGSGSDKAGGEEERQPVVLTLASALGSVPGQLDVFADEVARLSDGTLRVEFAPEWRPGDPNAEPGTIEDVKEGKVDMAWVGARVFDTLGVTSFQPLLAPLLVDSYDLERRVFESGLPEKMLSSVDELGVVGIGVLPGPMRKLVGVGHPFVRLADFEGQIVGGADNTLAERTFEALGATVRSVPAGGSLDGLDGLEQQLGSIWGNRYDNQADSVTSNLNLWPRPLVIVMGKQVFESLTPQQQTVLREAGVAAIPGALDASREEDEEAMGNLCRTNFPFVTSSTEELAELRRALEPVYAELASDAEAKSALDAISSLKSEIAISAEAPVCAPESEPSSADSGSASSIPDGTYETTVTEADWLNAGLSKEEASSWPTGVFRMVVAAGELTILDPPDYEPGFEGLYTVFRDQITAEDSTDRITARWSLEGDTLAFTDVEGGVPFAVVWGSHPWVRA